MTVLVERRARATAGPPSQALRYLPTTALVLDVVLVTLAGVTAVWGRRHLGMLADANDVTSSLAVAGPLILAGWVGMIAGSGAYRRDVFGAGTEEYKRVLNASLVTAGMLGVSCYLAKFQLSRGFFVLLFAVGVPVLYAGRFLLRGVLHRARRQGKLRLRALIAGSPSHVDEIAAVLRRESWLGYQVEGALVPDLQPRHETPSRIPVVGSCGDVVDVVRRTDVDVIFFAGGALSSASQLRQVAWDLEQEDVQVVVAPSVTDVSAERVRIRPVGGLPLVHIDPPRSTDTSRWGKRIFDAIGATVLIALFSPVFLVAALSIKLHDGGQVLYRQTRIGRGGREFTCLKFRTMVTDADAHIAALQAELGETALLFKAKDDPRITKPGRWLRRYSVDELPQLFNVLRGDMSLVGPRPQVAREVALYEGPMSRRLHVRPGMTGLWQVSGRSDLSWSEAVRLDLYYVDNWSALQDLHILGKTFGAVFGSRGAY